VGIIGLGYGAKIQLPAFLSLSDVKVASVADPDEKKMQHVLSENHALIGLNDWRDMIDDDEIDAISVATPPIFQSEIVCAALFSGKHVLCEKPFGRNLDDALRMHKVAKKCDLVNAVDFEFRMEPGISKLKNLVSSEIIGRMRRIDVTWFTGGRSDPSLPWSWQHDLDAGGGVLEAFGSHIVDYVEWICQSPIVDVISRSHKLINVRKGLDGIDYAVTADDSCDVICDLANGTVASLRFSNCYPFPSGHRIEIYGERGRLIYIHEAPFLPGSAKLWSETHSKGKSQVELAHFQTEIGLDTRVFAFREIASRFVEKILGFEGNDLPNFACGLRVRKVLHSIRKSDTSSKPEVASLV